MDRDDNDNLGRGWESLSSVFKFGKAMLIIQIITYSAAGQREEHIEFVFIYPI